MEKMGYHLFSTVVMVVWLEPGGSAGSKLVLVCHEDVSMRCKRDSGG